VSPDPRYPIGPFRFEAPPDDAALAALIDRIATQPTRLEAATSGLSRSQLDTPYREGGWTVRQLVHHVADSHLNAYCRCRLALTEDRPVIKPYDQDGWVRGADYAMEIGVSLTLLARLHERWVTLLRSLDDAALRRTFFHPEDQIEVSLEEAIAAYAWHGDHHIAHVNALRERQGW